MIDVLRDHAYARLFAAQVVALVGTGLLTVALSLLAFDIAGADAGVVLATALTIKMVAYVGVAPVIAAVAAHVPRKVLMIGADIVRAAVALCLPFVAETWHIYVLIFALQAASATFTPAFQAVIPEVLPDERDYTRALSLSRLAYDLEALVSPVLAAALLAIVSYHELFLGTVAGFVGSAVLVGATRLPTVVPPAPQPFLRRLSLGARVTARAPDLRALLALNVTIAAATALVIVNTVVLVQAELGRPQSDVAWMLAAYGAGSMVLALVIPRLLERAPDRTVMLVAAGALSVALAGSAAVLERGSWAALLAIWALLGAATSAVVTPSARLLRRGAAPSERPAVFAAQFALSHACYMITYPMAGGLGAAVGLPATAATLAVVAAAGTAGAARLWRERVVVG
ncbi:MAG: MFS transporter [Actinomycetes bacterium]